MKKIGAIIMIAISLIFMGLYIISMNSNKTNVSFNVKDLEGNRSNLGNDKIVVNIKEENFRNNQGIITKDSVNFSKANLETVRYIFNMSDSTFISNKELFRGHNSFRAPIYEDDQYKIVIGSVSRTMFSNSYSNPNILVSYLDKKTNRTNKLKLEVPNKYTYINLIGVENNNGILTFAFMGDLYQADGYNYGGSSTEQIEICSIDLKKGIIKSEKIFKDEGQLGKINNDNGQIYLKDGKLLRVVYKYDEAEDKTKEAQDKTENELQCISLKDYSIKSTELKDIDLTNVYLGKTKIYFYNIDQNKIILSSMDLKTKEIKKYDDIILSYSYKVDDSTESLWGTLLAEKEGALYFSINKYDDNRGAVKDNYIELIDIEKGNTLYKGEINGCNDEAGIEIELGK